MKHYLIKSYLSLFKSGIIFIMLWSSGCSNEKSTTDVPQNNSKLLSDNSLSKVIDFNNFKDEIFHINPTSYSFIGNRVFLKLSRNDNEILYLGEINPNSIFSISVQIRLDDTMLHYELFTNNDNDITQFGVVNL